jgi:general secretion pathway protein M
MMMTELKVKLNELQTKLNERWSHLNTREKQAVTVGGFFLGLFIIYACIWSPLVGHVVTLRHKIGTEQKELAWMKAADEQIQKMSGEGHDKTKSTNPVLMLGIVQKQLDQSGLAATLTQMKQSSNNAIEMHFQKVPFDRLIKLLTTLVKQQRVSISQFSSVADTTPGLANVDVVMELG